MAKVLPRLVAVTFLVNLIPHKAHAVTITLKDAVRSALEKTESVPLGQSRINQADARLEQTKSKFLPTVSLGANYQRQDSTDTKNSSIWGGGQSYARLTLSQSVYDGGRDTAALEANKSDKEAQKQILAVSNYSLFSTVARGFYAILSNQTEVDNLKKIIDLASDRVKEITNREKIGRSRNIELMAAQAQVAVLQAQLMAVEGQQITAWDEFVLLTGLPRDVELVKKRETPEAPQSIDTYLGLLEKRPDIIAMKSQIDSAKSNVDVARAGHRPSIDVLGNYYINRTGPQEGNNWDVGISLTMPLYNGGMVSAQVREASEKESEIELLLNQTRRQAEVTIRTNYNNLVSALNQMKALQSALSLTEKNYKEQSKNYRFGQSTNLDVIQALNLFQDTKRTLDKTNYLALAAWADLKAATAQISLANATGDL